MSWSCADAPARTSTTKTTASASATACSAWRAISLTMPVGFSGSKPPVSMTMNSWPPTVRVAVVPVARQAGEVGDDRIARLRHAVEERRLADVGPADEGDDGFHRRGRSPRLPPPQTIRRAEREHAAPAGDDDEQAADAHRRRRRSRCRRSSGAPATRPWRARTSATSARIAEDDRLPHRRRRAEAAEHERFRGPGDVAGGRSPGVDAGRTRRRRTAARHRR